VTVPHLSLTIEIEGKPRIELRAEGADLDSLFDWLSSEAVRRQLDALALLVTSRTRDD
jgi:hypothetical protein